MTGISFFVYPGESAAWEFDRFTDELQRYLDVRVELHETEARSPDQFPDAGIVVIDAMDLVLWPDESHRNECKEFERRVFLVRGCMWPDHVQRDIAGYVPFQRYGAWWDGEEEGASECYDTLVGLAALAGEMAPDFWAPYPDAHREEYVYYRNCFDPCPLPAALARYLEVYWRFLSGP